MTDQPTDHADVIKAIRLGWLFAEVRGRNRRMVECPAEPEITDLATRVLPLRVERSPTERRIEAQEVFKSLAEELEVNKNRHGVDVPTHIDEEAHAIYNDLYGPQVNRQQAVQRWAELSEQLYFFDAWIEDALAAKSEALSSGYQLGRGLAESYWFDYGRFATPPAADADAMWTQLLGEERCNELGRLVGSLSAYFGQFTGATVAGSLKVWQDLAGDEGWRETEATEERLLKQVRRWYELLVIGQDPTTLVKPYSVFRSFKTTWKAIQAFIPQGLIVLASFGGVVLLAYLSSEGKSAAWLNSLLAIASVAGVTIAGAQAKLKNGAQALLSRIRDDTYTELIAVDLVEVPNKPDLSAAKMRSYCVKQIRLRTLTTAN
jgi:hypothetical protein